MGLEWLLIGFREGSLSSEPIQVGVGRSAMLRRGLCLWFLWHPLAATHGSLPGHFGARLWGLCNPRAPSI